MHRIVRGLSLALACATAIGAQAQTAYPQKPVRIVVPFAPGGASDILARALSTKLSESLGQSFVVDNRPGAGGTLGAESVAKSAPDGYTLLLSDVAVLTVAPRLYPKLGYTPEQLVPVVNVASFAHILIAPPNSTLKSFADLLAQEKAKPGRFNSASSGNGTSTHLTIEMVNLAASTQIKHVPYKGGGAALTDVMSGQVDLMFIGAPPAMPLIRSGKLKALAVTTSSRMTTLPQVPTLAESGLPKFESVAAQGIFAPAGTPREIVNKLNAEVIRIIRQPDVRARWDLIGAEPVDDTPQQFSSWIFSELEKWGKVIQSSGAKPD
ncbi:MAG: tripartite tricarboxylate transporter substrate binding protein [Comamonadaceae bacterium]|jgi:tripartite-type tricarboxylate transporter receptor subunit TctC|nr:tripartite tricarboxylate transporter substrate binding protein [Comamonadaceae bacterium]